jgi:hypothetical protein
VSLLGNQTGFGCEPFFVSVRISALIKNIFAEPRPEKHFAGFSQKAASAKACYLLCLGVAESNMVSPVKGENTDVEIV